MVLGGDSDSRFSHLLQPIRDLTKNWDIDIASDLEDYLGEIEQITITFDGGTTTMNFSEAALLIQGSACVYSRKVEYLYALVYQVLDLLASKKQLQQKSSVDQDGNDGDAPQVAADKDEEFLTLDDIREHNVHEMKHDDGKGPNSQQSIPKTPLALAAQNDGEKGQNPLISRKGEVLASRNDFRMNTSSIRNLGYMLLDMSHLSLLDDSFRRLPASTPFPENNEPINDEITSDPGQACPVDIITTSDDHVDDHISIDDNFADNIEAATMVDEQRDFCKREDPMLRKSDRNRNRECIADAIARPVVDPWTSMDPHKATESLNKPLKKGRTFKIPPNVNNENNRTRKRKKNNTKDHSKLIPLTEFFKISHSTARKISNPLKVPSFPEFDRLFWKEHKRRQELQKQEKALLAAQGRLEELEERQDEDNEDNYEQFDPVDDNDPLDYDAPGVEPQINIEFQDPVFSSGLGFSEDDVILSSYEDHVRRYIDGYLAGAQQYAQVTELSKRVAQWEEKILPKLQEQEEHEPFDIHQYGTHILDRLILKQRVPFRQIVQGEEAFKICRLLLAALQLANNGNVEITQNGCLEEGVDKMELLLLNTKRHFEEIADYHAPSAV